MTDEKHSEGQGWGGTYLIEKWKLAEKIALRWRRG